MKQKDAMAAMVCHMVFAFSDPSIQLMEMPAVAVSGGHRSRFSSVRDGPLPAEFQTSDIDSE